jgi:hypothetical protein
VVNSVGSLQHLVRTRFAAAIAPPRGLLAPAYLAFALPINSGLKKPLDQALTAVTASPEWRAVEESYFGQWAKSGSPPIPDQEWEEYNQKLELELKGAAGPFVYTQDREPSRHPVLKGELS